MLMFSIWPAMEFDSLAGGLQSVMLGFPDWLLAENRRRREKILKLPMRLRSLNCQNAGIVHVINSIIYFNRYWNAIFIAVH